MEQHPDSLDNKKRFDASALADSKSTNQNTNNNIPKSNIGSDNEVDFDNPFKIYETEDSEVNRDSAFPSKAVGVKAENMHSLIETQKDRSED